MTTAAALPGLGIMLSNAGSLGGVNLSALGEGEKSSIVKGSLLTTAKPGTTESARSYTGDYTQGAMAALSGAQQEKAVESYTDTNYEKEQERAEKLQKTNEELNDNVKIIRDLLGKHGILVRTDSTTVEAADDLFREILLGNNSANAIANANSYGDSNVFKLIGG